MVACECLCCTADFGLAALLCVRVCSWTRVYTAVFVYVCVCLACGYMCVCVCGDVCVVCPLQVYVACMSVWGAGRCVCM